MPTLVQAIIVPKVSTSILTLYPQVLPVTTKGLIVMLPVDKLVDNLWITFVLAGAFGDNLWITCG